MDNQPKRTGANKNQFGKQSDCSGPGIHVAFWNLVYLQNALPERLLGDCSSVSAHNMTGNSFETHFNCGTQSLN
jgi:hypothetical protein